MFMEKGMYTDVHQDSLNGAQESSKVREIKHSNTNNYRPNCKGTRRPISKMDLKKDLGSRTSHHEMW